MSKWASAGDTEDKQLAMGDRGFVKVSARLEPDLLQPSEVTVSENGRMDRGAWQPRKGIVSLSGVLQETGSPLRLSFFLVDAVGGETIVSADRVDDLVTVEVTGHGFGLGLTGYVGIESLTGTVSPNGVQFITVVDADTFTFEIPGATGSETYGGTGKVRSVLDDTAAASILGSCLFSDPSSALSESVVIAANGTGYAVAVSDGTVSEIAYPTGSTLSGAVDLIQAFDRVFLFRDGAQAWEWFGPRGRSVSAAALAANVVTVTLKAHGLTVGDTVVLSDIGFVTTDPNGTRVVTSIPTADTFTFALTAANETYTANTGTAVTDFTKVQAGDYTQPQVFEETGTDVQVTSGLCTITGLTNTTVATGDTVVIYGSDNADFLNFVGRSFLVVSASSSSISFYIPVADRGTIGTDVLSVGRQVSVGAGLRNMPAPPWGVYHQRRLCVPYWYSQTGTTASPTFTDREVRDEIHLSDILDPYTFDTIENQFRVTAGIADFTVGMHAFAEDRLLVFNRNSIHAIDGVSGALTDTRTIELTREIGCLARKSIAQKGNVVLFLSDSGVYGLEFFNDYNLRGVDLPLSDPIQPYIDRINADLAADAVGIYFANRYWLAVPLDSSPGEGDATGNNSILVFNFLNQGWESVDFVDDFRWNILNFHIARAGERNDLYVVNDLGGVHQLDAADADSDSVAVSPGGDLETPVIDWRLETRQFDGETLDRKRFSEVQLQMESSDIPCDANVSVIFEDFDDTADLGLISDEADIDGPLAARENASIRKRIGGYRAQGAIVSVTRGSGRPKIKTIRLTGTQAMRSTTSVK